MEEDGGIIDGGNNFDSGTSCRFRATNSSLSDTYPLLLGPLSDNGGPTRTHALLPGSPAVNRGDNDSASGLPYDQRGSGFARISGGTVDIGAYELQLPGSTPRTPQSEQDCKKEGFRDFGFKNQGRWIEAANQARR